MGVALLCLFIMSKAQAQEITVDLKKIDPNLAAKILDAQKKSSDPKPAFTPDEAQKWSEIGESVAKAIAATAKGLSIEVNDFINTPVGKWSLFFVFWYLIGYKLWIIVGGILIWITLGSIILHSFKVFHIPRKKLVSETKSADGKGWERTYEYVPFKFVSNEAKVGSVWAHALSFGVLSLIMIFQVL